MTEEETKKIFIHCFRLFSNKLYYKGKPMQGVYVKVEDMNDDEIFEIIKPQYEKYLEEI